MALDKRLYPIKTAPLCHIQIGMNQTDPSTTLTSRVVKPGTENRKLETISLVFSLALLLLGAGCQHVAAPSLATQEKFFQSLKAANPEEERALRCAQYHNLVGRFDLALEELSRAVASDPYNIRLLNAMGNCCDKLGQYRQAQEAYEKILAREPGNEVAKNNLAYSCYLTEDFSRAEKLFQEILSHNPDNTVARNNLGLVWCRQGKESQALSLWQKNEGDFSAREKLNQVLAYLGKPGNHVSPTTKHPPAPAPETRQQAALQTEPKPASSELSGSSARGPAPGSVGLVKNRPSKLPEQVEEVQMIVQPAASSRINPESAFVREPAPLPGQREADIYAQSPVPGPHYYRPRPRKPKIIECRPEPPNRGQSMKKYLADELLHRIQKTSAESNPTFY